MPLNKLIVAFLLFFSTNLIFAQEKFTISGTVSDTKNNETLIGVNVIVKGTSVFAITNEYGFYSITLPKGDYELSVSYVSYETIDEKISLTQNIKKNFGLSESGEVLEEVISPFELQKSDELFITNVIKGIQPITKYRKKDFAITISNVLFLTASSAEAA